MTEEEQKAREIVNSLKEWGKIHFIVKDRSYARLNYDEVYLILTLISKLQEENKKLREGKDTAENELDNRIPKKDVEEILKKHKKAMKLAREQISEKIIIADSDSLNFGRKEAHNLIISDLIDLLKRSK